MLLNVLTERNPGFKIVFVGYDDRSFISSYLPLFWSKGLVQFYFPMQRTGSRSLVLCSAYTQKGGKQGNFVKTFDKTGGQ